MVGCSSSDDNGTMTPTDDAGTGATDAKVDAKKEHHRRRRGGPP